MTAGQTIRTGCEALFRFRHRDCHIAAATEASAARYVLWKKENKMMKHNVILAMLVGATLMLNACATVKGAGKDIQSVGEAGEEAINK